MSEWEKDRATIEAATPGPWAASRIVYDTGAATLQLHRPGDRTGETNISATPADAAFITRARTRWPAALVEIDRLRDLLEDRPAAPKESFDEAMDRAEAAIARNRPARERAKP